MTQNKYALIIQKLFLKCIKKDIFKKIRKSFIEHKEYFHYNIKKHDINLCWYEEAVGFDKSNRNGSRYFCQQVGYFFEKCVYPSSLYYTDTSKNVSGCDGETDTHCFEVTNKWNTKKLGVLSLEIKEKLLYAISKNKKFYFFVMIENPKKPNACNQPLHIIDTKNKKHISNTCGYNENIHRRITGTKIFEILFPRFSDEIQLFIQDLFSTIRLK